MCIFIAKHQKLLIVIIVIIIISIIGRSLKTKGFDLSYHGVEISVPSDHQSASVNSSAEAKSNAAQSISCSKTYNIKRPFLYSFIQSGKNIVFANKSDKSFCGEGENCSVNIAIGTEKKEMNLKKYKVIQAGDIIMVPKTEILRELGIQNENCLWMNIIPGKSHYPSSFEVCKNIEPKFEGGGIDVCFFDKSLTGKVLGIFATPQNAVGEKEKRLNIRNIFSGSNNIDYKTMPTKLYTSNKKSVVFINTDFIDIGSSLDIILHEEHNTFYYSSGTLLEDKVKFTDYCKTLGIGDGCENDDACQNGKFIEYNKLLSGIPPKESNHSFSCDYFLSDDLYKNVSTLFISLH